MMTAARWSMVAYWETKAGTDIADWEDGAAYSRGTGWFAVADGASAGGLSREWAYRLVRDYVSDQNASTLDDGGLGAWVTDVRSRFDPRSEEFPASRSPDWVQEESVRRGAHATLLAGRFDQDGVRVVAVGDTCLVHLRSGMRLASFPLVDPADFGTQPDLIASRAQALLAGVSFYESEIDKDDIILVATDALAAWLLGLPADSAFWPAICALDHHGFARLCTDLRAAHLVRNDDMTLLRAGPLSPGAAA